MVLWRYSYGLWSYGNALAGLLSSLHSLRVVWQRCSEHLLRVGLQLHHSAVTCWWLNSSCSQIHTASQCSLVLSPLTMATKEETDSPNGSAKREGDTVPYSDAKRPKHTEEGFVKHALQLLGIPRCMMWLLEHPEDCESSWAMVRRNRTLRTWSSCDFTEKNFKDREEVPGGTTYRQGDTIWFKELSVNHSGAVIARTSQGFVNFYNRSDAKVRIDWS